VLPHGDAGDRGACVGGHVVDVAQGAGRAEQVANVGVAHSRELKREAVGVHRGALLTGRQGVIDRPPDVKSR
jgi:hypothetical protein